MKVLIVGINAKYVHSNLAIRYIKCFCEDIDGCSIDIEEFTINDTVEKIVGIIYGVKPDAVGISCYIWNIDIVLKVCYHLKLVLPDLIIILGGPEVSYDSKKLAVKNRSIDFIVKGEGEGVLKELLQHLKIGRDPCSIKGLTFMGDNRILDNPMPEAINPLDGIPFPYGNRFEAFKDRLVYYETSRGCPYQCTYCLSSIDKGVRYFSIDRVKADLLKFINGGIKTVKLVDRTFNCNVKRAWEIFKFLIDNRKNTSFHFEIGADTFHQTLIDIVSKAPVGLFQFEIGVQTTNAGSLKAINRKMDYDKVKRTVEKLHFNRNIHLHLDLIAGLPMEDYSSFAKSFNDVYILKPDRLQLGFLKLLKGSPVRKLSHVYSYKYTKYPPYQVMSNKYMSYAEILRLKSIEQLVELYANSHGFDCCLCYMAERHYKTYFDFFEDLSIYWERKQYHRIAHSQVSLYRILKEFYIENVSSEEHIFNEVLRFDFLKRLKTWNVPDWMGGTKYRDMKSLVHGFLKRHENIDKYLPGLKGIPPKEIIKRVYFDIFMFNIDCFINNKSIYKNFVDNTADNVVGLFNYDNSHITGRAESYFIDLNIFKGES